MCALMSQLFITGALIAVFVCHVLFNSNCQLASKAAPFSGHQGILSLSHKLERSNYLHYFSCHLKTACATYRQSLLSNNHSVKSNKWKDTSVIKPKWLIQKEGHQNINIQTYGFKNGEQRDKNP